LIRTEALDRTFDPCPYVLVLGLTVGNIWTSKPQRRTSGSTFALSRTKPHVPLPLLILVNKKLANVNKSREENREVLYQTSLTAIPNTIVEPKVLSHTRVFQGLYLSEGLAETLVTGHLVLVKEPRNRHGVFSIVF
jgi:hypothetical protein